MREVSGTAAFPVRYEYGVDADGAYTKEIRLTTSGGQNEWTKTYTDMLGRSYKTVYAAASGTPYSLSVYNNLGQLTNQVDPDGNAAFYEYNTKGELSTTVVDWDKLGKDLSADRVTHTEQDVFETDGSQIWDSGIVVKRTKTWQHDDNGNDVLLSENWVSADGLHSATTSFGLTSKTDVEYDASHRRIVTATAPDGSVTITTNQYGQVQSVTRKPYSASSTILSQTLYGYDDHGRQNFVTNSGRDSLTYTFNNADQVVEALTCPPGTFQAGQLTTNTYDNMGRLTITRLPDRPENNCVFNEYYPNGLLRKTYGSRTYPVEYSCDAQGRMATMTTWQSFASNSGRGITRWFYDEYRGWLKRKQYDADGTGPQYTYTPGGRLESRTWARGTTDTYHYNGAGDLIGVDSSDNTYDVGFGYDRRGRQTSITNGATRSVIRSYNDAGALLSELNETGPLAGLSVTNGYDNFNRRTDLVLLSNSVVLTSTAYTYAEASRLSSVSQGDNTAAYYYLANSPLVEQIRFSNASVERMVTTKSYDLLNRLMKIETTANGSALASFAYTNDLANLRRGVTNVDHSRWVYTYDQLGQVIAGNKYSSNNTPVPGQQFEYAFDDIGNRKFTKSGQDLNSGQPHTATYWNNLLNQITWREVPGYAGVSGDAKTNSTVSVNNRRAVRGGQYWWGEALANNSTGAVWLAITNIGACSNTPTRDIVTNITGHVLLPKTPQQFLYDLDGNLTNDRVWSYAWDAENRLVAMESCSGIPTAAKMKLDFSYDSQGRRIQKVVYTNDGSGYVGQYTNRFIYDGWNLIGVLGAATNLQQSFVWGLDLSGSMQGAGGVGGLLAMQAHTGDNAGVYFYSHDGNGNVMALVKASDGAVTAQYEYGP